MKKGLILVVSLIMLMSVLFVGCGAQTLKFGAGVYVTAPTVADATEDKDGSGKIDVTVAAVTVDAEGKIVSCALDTSSNTVNFTADGKAVAKDEFKTKYEQGNDYNMVAYGGATKEWFEHRAYPRARTRRLNGADFPHKKVTRVQKSVSLNLSSKKRHSTSPRPTKFITVLRLAATPSLPK